MKKHIATTIQEYLSENKVESNLNYNFKKWFSNSKVVSINGDPLIVYHGTNTEIDEFIDIPTYFTDDYMNADGYASGNYVYECYLNIKKPLIVDCQDKKWDDIESPHGSTTHNIVINVDRSKYDGVIFINVKDSWIDDIDYQDSATIYVTLSPKQIKSVYNDGTWNKNNIDIYA